MFCLFSCVAVVVVFVVCVCLCFFFFGTFTLILSSSASVRFGSFRFGGFKYYVMFSARDKRHLFMSFLEVWTPSNGAIYLPPLPLSSFSSFSLRCFVDVNININSWKLNWSRLFRAENSPSLVAIKVSCPRFESGLTL